MKRSSVQIANAAEPPENPTVVENRRPGDSAWTLGEPATVPEIQGYASLTSLNRGEQIDLFVSTSVATSYRIDVYRLGWYGGSGARLMTSIPPPGAPPLPGKPQSIPVPDAASGLIECNWSDPYRLAIPSGWPSGVYVAKLTAQSRKQSYIVFVVRDDSRAAKHLFLSSVNTYQAYSNWGGKSLYDFNSLTPITWQVLRGTVAVSGSSLSTSKPTIGWDAVARSVQAIQDGYLEVVAGNPLVIFGLSSDQSGFNFNGLEYSIFLDKQFKARVRERGRVVKELGPWTPGDRFRISVLGQDVRYSRNGVVPPGATHIPGDTHPPLFAAALPGEKGATVASAALGGLADSRARHVSFNRPYAFVDAAGNQSPQNSAGQLLHYESHMLRWLEREGYDVTYATDVDLHANPSLLVNHRAVLVPGHPEYWSREMRSSVEAAAAHGISFGYFAANGCYWQVRFEPSRVNGAPNRTLVCYKDNRDPFASRPEKSPLTTVQWRDAPLSLPEDAFIGVMYEHPSVDAAIIVTNPAHWAFANTNVKRGDRLPGLLGYEADRVFENAPAGMELLAQSPVGGIVNPQGDQPHSDVVVCTAPSGAITFATGSMYWCLGLNGPRPNAVAEQVTRNVLGRFESVIPAPQPVVWTNAKGVKVSGHEISKVGSTVRWDAGASSVQAIGVRGGYLEFTATDRSAISIAGLSHRDASQSHAEIEFAILLDASRNAYVYESGSALAGLGPWGPEDRFRVEIQVDGAGHLVRYVKYPQAGNEARYSHRVGPTFPLVADISLCTEGATVSKAAMLGSPLAEPVAWIDTRGITISGNTIRKTGSTQGWDAGASSAQVIINSAGGYVEFSASAASRGSMAGLNARKDAAASFDQIDFAILIDDRAEAWIRESGREVASLGRWNAEDRFRVEVRNGLVKYSKLSRSGDASFTSSVPPQYPLVARAALQRGGATVSNAVMLGIQSLVGPLPAAGRKPTRAKPRRRRAAQPGAR